MKNTISLSILIFIYALGFCQSPKSTTYIDFGPDDNTNGNSTIGKDINENIWNNVTSPSSSSLATTLLNHQEGYTGFSFNMSSSMSSNGKLHGGLINPQPSLLDDFAIASVTQDYFFTSTTGSIKFSGLNPANKYIFYVFGSREASEIRTSSYTFVGLNSANITLTTSGSTIGANGYNGNNNKVAITDSIQPATNGTINLTITKIVGTFAYLNAIKIEEFSGQQPDDNRPIDSRKIVYFGSSVPYGYGASPLSKGYTSLYTKLLIDRNELLGKLPWQTSNISVAGDNTVKVLNRYTSDFIPQKAKYVVFALSLGNEGIHDYGQVRYDRFKTNIQQLIKQAKDGGFVPIVTNCYVRNDFNDTDYQFVKQMNIFLAELDVPTINLLGSVDDGTGRWVDGYWSDALHPNNNGHEEMYYSITPSLFDALDQNKPMPQKLNGSHITLTKEASDTKGKSIRFIPENIVHSFTNIFRIKTTNTGIITEVKESSAVGNISIGEDGTLTYNSPRNGKISGNVKINDDNWHYITLTHYYAKGKTVLYCDSSVQGSLDEKLAVQQVNLGASNHTGSISVKDWSFYRSGMNEDEIRLIARGKLLKSSLELYAPLDGKLLTSTDSLSNLALSTNSVNINEATLPLKLLTFTSVRTHNGIQLKWKTENEVDLKGFIVERSNPNGQFAACSPLINPGNSSYQFTDTELAPSMQYYYRLKSLDLNGKYSYSNILSTRLDLDDKNPVAIYPNPFSNSINLQAIPGRKYDLDIFDTSGKKVFTNKGVVNLTNVSLMHLVKGPYVIVLSENSNEFCRKLIIKN